MHINLMLLSWLLAAMESEQKPKIDFAVGGQAVIEGVMMRSPEVITISVRKKDGSIKRKKDKYRTLAQRYRIFNIPIVRGMINLVEMMVVGSRAINWSANEMVDGEMTEEEKAKYEKSKHKIGVKIFEGFMFLLSLVLGVGLALFLFKALPLGLTTLLEERVKFVEDNWMIFNLIDGVIKMLVFLSYIYVLTLFKSFRRIFEYHGAEHKSIFTYERGLGLTPENAKKQTRFHPRCGTSFILVVIVISILVYTFVPKQDTFVMNLGMRLLFLPLIAGISYEYLKLSAKYANRGIIKALVTPGLWFQRLTTKEPDDKQLEVGLDALKKAL